MEIRPGRPADVPLVLPLLDEQARIHTALQPSKFSYVPDFTAGYGRWMTKRADDPTSCFLVAEREPGTIVGFLIASVEDDIPIYSRQGFGFIHDMFVADGYRNEGLGRQMLVLAIEHFAKTGCTQVRLEVATGNDAAALLFERNGFTPVSQIMTLELPTMPAAGE